MLFLIHSFPAAIKKRWMFLTKSMKVSERGSGHNWGPSPISLLRVTKGIEGLEGCHGRLLHTAVPAPWKWSYGPSSPLFLYSLSSPSVLFSPLKTFHRHSTLTQQGRGKTVRVEPSKTRENGKSGGIWSDGLTKWSTFASLFRVDYLTLKSSPSPTGPPP